MAGMTMTDVKNEVWIVDDELELAQAYSDFISDRYPCRVFHSAQDALVAFEQDSHELGLVLSDVKMPVMDGISLIEKLREKKMTEPVIMVSGHAEKDSLVKATNLELSGFLEKPFSPVKLNQAIDRAMNHSLLQKLNHELVLAYEALIGVHKELLDSYFQRALTSENALFQAKVAMHKDIEEKRQYLKTLSEEYKSLQAGGELESQIRNLKSSIANLKTIY